MSCLSQVHLGASCAEVKDHLRMVKCRYQERGLARYPHHEAECGRKRRSSLLKHELFALGKQQTHPFILSSDADTRVRKQKHARVLA